MRRSVLLLVAGACSLCVAQQKPAPVIAGLGSHTFPVTTSSKEAQTYFDQGLILAYGFNHPEAHRSFLYAAELDPKCAMAYWGAALVLGPNLNAGMPPSANKEAHDLAQKALDNLDDESPVERALVRALQKRYSGAERKRADEDYADAMRDVARQFPEDPDVLTLTAEALMDLHPWNFYKRDQTPQPWTKEITDMLDRSIKIDPTNPATNHFIIHAWEASTDPSHAIPCADRLQWLVPGVEHLAHMPSHIYLRVGRYHEATECNLRAAKAYDDYAAACEKVGLEPIGGYKMHNWDFMWAAASMEGNSAIAFKAANLFHDMNPRDSKLIYSQVRFGRWDDLIAAPVPENRKDPANVSLFYGKAIAYVRKGNIDDAQKLYAELLSIIGEKPNTYFQIARDLVAGEIAAAKGDYDAAVRSLEGARDAEDSMGRAELASWHQPVRLVLGRVLIDAGRFMDAEKAYRECLDRDPENGWSLIGLAQSLQGQGKAADATRVMARFHLAWQYADVELTSSEM